MQNETLILSGAGYNLSIAPEAEAQKAELLGNAAKIQAVDSALSSDAAGAQIKLLAAMRNLVEKSRTTVKAPVIKVGKDIDAKAMEFVSAIKDEEDRLKLLQSDYALVVMEERNRMLAEVRAKEAAEAKARHEAEMEAKRQAEAAEKARRDAEAVEWDAVTPEEEAEAKRKAAEAEAARMKAEAAAAAEAARIAALPVAPVFVPEAPKGVKMVADFDVIDLDLLYRADCSLVKMEAKRAEILDAIKRQTVGDTLPTIPGLRVFLKPSVSTR